MHTMLEVATEVAEKQDWLYGGVSYRVVAETIVEGIKAWEAEQGPKYITVDMLSPVSTSAASPPPDGRRLKLIAEISDRLALRKANNSFDTMEELVEELLALRASPPAPADEGGVPKKNYNFRTCRKATNS